MIRATRNDYDIKPAEKKRKRPRRRPAPELAPLLITPDEAARLYSVCTRTLQMMTQPRGPIPVIRIGRSCVRYSRAVLEASIPAIEAWAAERARENSGG